VSEQALKLTAFFGERARVRGNLLADELLDAHARHGVRASILLRGVQGFGAKHRLSTDRLLTLSEDLPLVSVAIDAPERIEEVASELRGLGHRGLLALERARLGTVAEVCEGSEIARARPSPRGDDPPGTPNRTDVKLTIYLGRHQRVDGSPAFLTVCKTLSEREVAGATVLLGVDGTLHGERRRGRFFGRNRGVPLMISSVGDPQPIDAALRELLEVLPEQLLTIEHVLVCKRDGELLRHPREHAPERACSLQKLTIVTSEAARHENRPVYLELIARLRAAGAAGATSLRGIWGFHGDHAPHGDRLLSIRRHVPVLTIAIDTPERIAELFPLVDELTRERGLVTSEIIPTAASRGALQGAASIPPGL
jgi:PII-like signaling protein